ncbi:hypothetical protein [Luteimonas mephitis]|uniref:hypothetical protein n=1 Tax=Luteimonas mephitis TaxID=83615 RepID=UPI003A949B66
MGSRAEFLAEAFPQGRRGPSAEVQAAIEGATFVIRESDDDGPRVFVVSPALHGSFLFSRDEAARRLRKSFPELGDEAVDRAVRHLHSRLKAHTQPAAPTRRNGLSEFVHGWREW